MWEVVHGALWRLRSGDEGGGGVGGGEGGGGAGGGPGGGGLGGGDGGGGEGGGEGCGGAVAAARGVVGRAAVARGAYFSGGSREAP